MLMCAFFSHLKSIIIRNFEHFIHSIVLPEINIYSEVLVLFSKTTNIHLDMYGLVEFETPFFHPFLCYIALSLEGLYNVFGVLSC